MLVQVFRARSLVTILTSSGTMDGTGFVIASNIWIAVIFLSSVKQYRQILLSFAIGYLLFLRVGETLSYAAVLLPTMMLVGIGFALAFPAVNVAATTGVADHEQGLASGLVNTSFQVGGALILAIVTAVMTSGWNASTAAPGSPDALLDGYVPGLILVAAASLAGLAVAASGLIRRRETAIAYAGPAPVEDLPRERQAYDEAA